MPEQLVFHLATFFYLLACPGESFGTRPPPLCPESCQLGAWVHLLPHKLSVCCLHTAGSNHEFLCQTKTGNLLHTFEGGWWGWRSYMLAKNDWKLLDEYLWYSYSFTRSLMHSFIHSFTHSLTHSLVHSLTPSLIYWFIHSFIHSLIHSLPHSFIHSLTHSFIHSFILFSLIHSLDEYLFTQSLFIHCSFIYSFMHPFFNPSIHPFIHSFIQAYLQHSDALFQMVQWGSSAVQELE